MIDSGTEVSTMHHREVHGYYVALQKYFNNAENKHDRSNSQRAQKARAKLLKLSASQFYELSTDVYDELQRRISDDQSQPEYLLPKASFHMKRNQARQKLANLSHTRFNDLVDDILYEINRRGYNMPPDPETDENTSSNSMAATGSSTPNSRRAKTSHIRSSANQSLGSDASASASNSHIPPTATIQTSQVIPQKASIDWSSDEEQDTKKNDSNTNTNNVNSNISNHNYNQESIGAVQPSSISAQQQPNTTPILNPADTYHHYGDVMDSPALTENGANQRGEETLTVGPPRNRHSSAFDFEGISRNELNETKSIQSSDETPNKDQLDQLYGEIEALKKENANLGGSRNFDRIALSENLGNEINSLKEEVESLSMENGKLKAKISELETKLKKPRFQSKPALSLPFTNDQNQNELRKLLLDKESVTRYTAQDGSIPFESVRETHEYIQKLFIDLQANVDDIGHALFEDLARLSHTVAQLFILVDVPDYKEEVILLKASLSHAITSIRYFAVYGALLPQITVKAAISELAFAFCNLVRSCKIKGDGRGGTALSSNKAGMTNDTKSPVDPQTPNEAIFPDMPNSKSKSPFNRPAVVNKFDDDDFGRDEMSPVKPLKLTKRACMSPNMRTPSSARKLSHSGFPFGPMVDTRSPASHEKGSSTTHSFENTRKINETSPTSPYSGNLGSGSLAERVGDFFQDRDVSGKKDESFTDSHDRNDPNRTLNDNVTPEKSTTTSRATTAEGTTRLSTPLSAASPDNYQVKLRESFLGGPNTETQENRELSIQDKKIQNNKDFSKSRDVVGVRDINQDDNDSVDSDNGCNSPNDAYHVNRLPTSEDFPDMKNKTIDTKDSLLPADLSKVENNHYGNSRYPMEAEDSHDLTRSSYSNGPPVEEKQEYLSNSPSAHGPQEPLSHNDSESTVTSRLAPEETKGTPDAIKDTICKLEGNSAPDFEEMSGPGLHEAPVEPKYIQEEPKLTNTRKEIEPKEQEQEKKSGKNIGKSFTEKLRTFATNAGIGLKADKEQKEKEAATSQDKSRNSRDSNSNEGATDISVTENGKTSSISDADSKVPAVSNLNKSSDDNSAVDLFRTTEMRGLETDGNEKITPFEKSFEKNNDEFDDTDSNLGNSKPDNKTGHGKTDEFGVPQISNGLASSQDKKNMKADDELKNGSSLQSPSRDVNGDAAQTDDDMKGGSSLRSPLRGMNDEASQTGYGLKEGSSFQSPPRGMNSDASQAGDDTKGGSFESSPHGMNDEASQTGGDMKYGSFESPSRDVNGDAAQTDDVMKGGSFLQSPPRGMNGEASQTGGNMKDESFESPPRDVNGDVSQTGDDMKNGSLQSPLRSLNRDASQTGDDMKNGSFLQSPLRDMNSDASQTGGGIKNGSFLQNLPRSMNSDTVQSISVTPSVTLNDGKREMDITPKDESRTFENRLGHDKGAPSKLPNFYFNNMPQPPTNPNLTDKLKETFADFPSEDENEEGSDFNNSPYMSDNGSVFRAFKQSLKEENAASGSPLIQQYDFHYTDSKTSNEPAGLGISEKTDLKHDNDPAGFSSGLDDGSKFGATKQIEDKNEHLNHISETAPHVASQNHSKEEISKKEHDISASHGKKIEDISHNDRSDQRNRSDFSDSDDIDGSMVNSKSLRQHEKIDSDHDEGANALSKHTTESKQESPLKESVENENHEGTQERWMSTDEEDNYDSDSFNDALTENNDGPSEQHSNNLQNHPEQRHISDFNDLEDNISDDTHSQRDSRSFNHEDFHSKTDGHDASEVPTIHGTTEERGQLDTTSIDEHSDDLNADPSFAEDKEVSNRPASILNGDAVPQLQPVKVITSNGHSHVPSSDKAESMEDEDVTRSPNIPKTPVMKNSSRPQTMKTPYGNTPFFNSPSGRSPGAKSLASARTDDVEYTFDVDAFDIENPDNTLSELLLYLEHQSLQVIATIQSLLTSIKEPQATKGNLRKESNAISQVIRQMVDATSVSMNQSRNASLKEHGSWVVKSLEDCYLRMITLCQLSRTGKFGESSEDTNYANKHFKQRLAGIAFDIAKCTKELVKTVEEASLKEEIEFLNSRLN